jgi:hypothetical protein
VIAVVLGVFTVSVKFVPVEVVPSFTVAVIVVTPVCAEAGVTESYRKAQIHPKEGLR